MTETLPDTDIAIIGAGPVGLMLANLLARGGSRITLLEQLPSLIDYPRGVGIDDEALRVFQSVGLCERILPHITPHQSLIYTNARGKPVIELHPSEEPFGWPRRNTFIQPQLDRITYEALADHPNVRVLFGHGVQQITQGAEGVEVAATGPEGQAVRLAARWLVGCDGGRSNTRKALDVSFEGVTVPTRWLVVDIANDPIGTPGSQLLFDPKRPAANIALPHGVRRLEFMLMPHERDEDMSAGEGLHALLRPYVPDPARADLIRSRVYVHSGRVAGNWRKGRVMIAGDAAHLMPVAQGQGYNTGMRDANNLAWKLDLVARGVCGPGLLDTYTEERKPHAAAMVRLSMITTRAMVIRNPVLAWLRDRAFDVIGLVPGWRAYFAQLKFKPMPYFQRGVVVARGARRPGAASPVGRLFPQPRVIGRGGARLRLDEATGPGFTLLTWGTPADRHLDDAARAVCARLAMPAFTVVPEAEGRALAAAGDTRVIGDPEGVLRRFFITHDCGAVVLRPDRVVALACRIQDLPGQLAELARVLHLNPDGEPA